MTRPTSGRRPFARSIAAVVLMAGVAAGCVSVAATPSPTPAPTPVVTPSPSIAAQSPSASRFDPLADLTIAAPFTLNPMDAITQAALDAGMKQALGSFYDVVQLGYRQAAQGSTPEGYIVGFGVPGMSATSSPTFLDQLVSGIAGTNPVTKATIMDTPVRFYTDPNTKFTYGIYPRKDSAIVVFASNSSATQALVAALLQG